MDLCEGRYVFAYWFFSVCSCGQNPIEDCINLPVSCMLLPVSCMHDENSSLSMIKMRNIKLETFGFAIIRF